MRWLWAFPPPRWPRPALRPRPHPPSRPPTFPPPSLPIEKGASLAHAAPGALRAGRRGRVPRQCRQIHQGDRRRGQGRLRRLGGHQPADRGDLEFRRRPRHHHRLLRRAAHLCRQAGRTDRRRRLSRQALWRLAAAGAEIRQAQQEQCLDRTAVRRHRRPADLPQVDPAIGRLRQGAGRSCRDSGPVPEAAEGRQAGRLRARQRQGRRQRLCQLGAVVAQRLPARRGGQRHHQQQGDHRRAEMGQGAVPDLHRRHAVVERRQQQPRLLLAGNLADRQRRLAVFLAEERSGDQGDRRGQRASVAAEGPGQDLADGGPDAERHGVQAQPVSQRRKGVPAVHAGEGPVRAVAQRQLRLLVAAAGRLCRRRGLVERSQGRDLQGHHEQHLLRRLQGPDLDGDRRRQRRLRAGADVRRGCDRRLDAGSRRRGSRAALRSGISGGRAAKAEQSAVIACNKREAFVQGAATKQSILRSLETRIASLRSQ